MTNYYNLLTFTVNIYVHYILGSVGCYYFSVLLKIKVWHCMILQLFIAKMIAVYKSMSVPHSSLVV